MVEKYAGYSTKFSEPAVVVPEPLPGIIVDCLRSASTEDSPFLMGHFFPDLYADPDDQSRKVDLDLIVSARATGLMAEILAAAAAGTLRAKPRLVVQGSGRNNIYVRVVMFIGKRVVGQLFTVKHKRSLQFKIAEPSHVCDFGDGTLLLISLATWERQMLRPRRRSSRSRIHHG